MEATMSGRSPSIRNSVLTCAGWVVWLLLAASRAFAKEPVPAPPAEAAAAPLNQLTAAEIAAGWIRLFDGETLFGWKSNRDSVPWKIANGVISAEQGDKGLLVTTSEFADYELRCDYRVEAGGNSGIFLRTVFNPQDPSRDCYELNTCDTHPAFPTGSLVGVVKPDNPVTGEGIWRTFHVRLLGTQVTVALDGQQILNFKDPRPAARLRGYIGLQRNAGRAEFRNIFLRPLNTRSLFTGTDLTGWRVVPGSRSSFHVTEGALHVLKGRGFLETVATYGDFALQAEVRTAGKQLNSGIFLRAMTGTEKDPSNGYEVQIHNAWKGNDRTKPADFGTGAIYRRVPARKVVSQDFEWFTLTVLATGPHFGVWVNGEQVTDWTDTRKLDENPRKGQRLSPGHLSLQGHDPTTDILFRNLRISPFPAEKSS